MFGPINIRWKYGMARLVSRLLVYKGRSKAQSLECLWCHCSARHATPSRASSNPQLRIHRLLVHRTAHRGMGAERYLCCSCAAKENASWAKGYSYPRSRFSRGLSAMNLAFSGPIFSLNLAGQPVVVLNNHKVVADLLGWSEVVWPFPADC